MPPVGDVALSLFLFVVAGLMEVGGGWLVWQALREGSPAWHAVLGALVLAGYGFVPVAQPDSVVGEDAFARVYAAYGGFFIILSFAWGAAIDGMRLCTGDYVGACVALVGVLIVLLWPRDAQGDNIVGSGIGEQLV
uniref:Uncharacterized protein n=1 Tax=Prasinoderma coloniale TaxID=156133 RepID=A0A7R9Y034_9VIRI